MKEYENKIYHGDCYEFIKKVPDGYFDLIITDPPYEMNNNGTGKTNINSLQKYKSNNFEDITNGFDLSLLDELIRVCSPFQAYICCSNAQISKLMSYFEDKKYYVNLLVWHKPNAVPFSNGVWKSDLEFIVHVRESGAYFQGNSSIKSKLFQHSTIANKKGHPTEKPIRLIEKFLQISATQGMKVFDPFMGSGTTAEACKSYGIDFYGCEKESKYVDICNKRLSAVQMNLFSAEKEVINEEKSLF